MLKRCPKISNNEHFLVSNKLLENIIGVKITMHHFLRVNMVKRDTDHCKNSNNMFFWNLIILIAGEKVC